MKSIRTGLLLPSIALASTSLFATGAALAAEVEAEFRTTYMNTDNVTRSEINEIEEDIWTIGTSLAFLEETARSSTDIRAVFDYLDYQDDTFDSEIVGGLDALINLTLVQEKLFWIIQNNYGQRMFDPLATPNADNRENVNFFTTGPDLELPMGTRHFFGAQGRYSTIRYEESPFDNERTSGLVRLGRRTSLDSNLSLNVSTEQVKFDNDGLSDDYDINEAYIRYEVLNSRNVINAELGYTELDLNDSTSDGYLVRLDWSRLSSEVHGFVFSGGSEYSSQGDVFRFSQNNSSEIGGTADVDGDDSPFRSHFFLARYNLNADRTTVILEAEWNQDDYELEPDPLVEALDRDVWRASFFIERDLTSKLFARFNIESRSREYKYIDRSDDDLGIGLTLGFRFTEAFNVFVSVVRDERDSTTDGLSFEENRTILGFAYLPAWGR